MDVYVIEGIVDYEGPWVVGVRSAPMIAIHDAKVIAKTSEYKIIVSKVSTDAPLTRVYEGVGEVIWESR